MPDTGEQESKQTGETRKTQSSRRWRPVSFYLLLIIPLVMLLGLQMVTSRDNPRRFALVLSLMFLFFGILLLRAVMDLFDIARRRLREERDSFRDTLGDKSFTNALRRRIRERKR
ncbi:MAG: hypothetical protein KA184_02315 [Candidatus Hydrogenedentes bacterium]|nr:hypothetical protein [Candidatus Hydrogenedentota bacterium]